MNDFAGSWVPDYRKGMRPPWRHTPIRDLADALEKIAELHAAQVGLLCPVCDEQSPCRTFQLATMKGPTA